MPDFDSNPWELYSSLAGWQEASQELTAALKDAIRNAHLARADGASRQQAEQGIIAAVAPLLRKHKEFGADDSEGQHYLERKAAQAFE